MKISARGLLASLFAPLVAFAVACGSSSSSPPGASDGGVDATADGSSADGATDGGADGGADLFPSDATKIVVTNKGGFRGGAPDGSTCSQADSTYTLLLPTRDLSWKICESSDSGSNAFTTGQTTIPAGDFAALSSALHALRRATKTQCGADKSTETIAFTTPTGDATYYDDFYFCDASDKKAYVTGLDAVLEELDKLAK